LVSGVVRRSGPKGVSLRGTGAWELGQIAAMWRSEGTDAVVEFLLEAVGGSAQNGGVGGRRGSRTQGARKQGANEGAADLGSGRGRRVLVHPSGFRQSPWADIEPTAPPTKLWHASPGSSGW